MKDLSMYRIGRVGKGDHVHILTDEKTICNSAEGVSDPTLTVRDVTCKRCINPMHSYKPYKDLMAQESKAEKKSKRAKTS